MDTGVDAAMTEYRLEHIKNDHTFWWEIIKTDDRGKELARWSDNGEPEDALFVRDYKWVLPELQELAAEVTRLRAALEFYSDETNYHHMLGFIGECTAVREDIGDIARMALKTQVI